MSEKYEPTQMQIQDGCKVIRDSWTDAERRRRGAWLHKYDLRAVVPQFSNDDIRFAFGGGSVER